MRLLTAVSLVRVQQGEFFIPGSMVKRLRHRPFTAVTGVQIPLESLKIIIVINLELAETETDADKRQKFMNVVIVGGGPSGVEIAGALEIGRASCRERV